MSTPGDGPPVVALVCGPRAARVATTSERHAAMEVFMRGIVAATARDCLEEMRHADHGVATRATMRISNTDAVNASAAGWKRTVTRRFPRVKASGTG